MRKYDMIKPRDIFIYATSFALVGGELSHCCRAYAINDCFLYFSSPFVTCFTWGNGEDAGGIKKISWKMILRW